MAKEQERQRKEKEERKAACWLIETITINTTKMKTIKKLRDLFHKKNKNQQPLANLSGNDGGGSDSAGDFDNRRYIGRLTGYCWAIIETRDKSFDADELKKQPLELLAIRASGLVNKEEKDVIIKLLELMDKAPKTDKDFNRIIGGLEGRDVVLKNLPCSVLLEKKKI